VKGFPKMASKVYWIGLRATLNFSQKYIQRNQLQLQANLSAPQYTCVLSVLTAILDCLALLPTNTPVV
jgi:hypothetical protein